MKKLLPLLAILFLVATQSCKQNVCEGVVCNNGGTCKDGSCECPPGFSGADCSQQIEPCDTLVCLNGALCSNGLCQCPPHTSGTNCQIQEAPAYIDIWRLTVESFNPGKPGGGVWDGDGKADIYPVIKRGTDVIFNGINYKANDASYTTFYPMLLGSDSILIYDITNNNYSFELWDYNAGGTDELMYSKSFTPYTDSTGFRGSIELTDTSAYYEKFVMGVYFRYHW